MLHEIPDFIFAIDLTKKEGRQIRPPYVETAAAQITSLLITTLTAWHHDPR